MASAMKENNFEETDWEDKKIVWMLGFEKQIHRFTAFRNIPQY